MIRFASRAFTIFIILIFSSTLGYALENNEQEPVSWYQIEILLFKNNQDQEQDKKQILVPENLIPQERFVLVSGESMVENQLQRLPKDTLKLNKAFNSLKRNKNYDVLEFAGWKQPLNKEQDGLPVSIAAGTQYGDKYEMQGNVTFRKNRYLHIDADFYIADYAPGNKINLQQWLLQGDPDAAPFITSSNTTTNNTALNQLDSTIGNNSTSPLFFKDSQSSPTNIGNELNPSSSEESTESVVKSALNNYVASNVAHLNESRRMRSGEIHYLDHPRFGLLVTIEPTDPPFVFNMSEPKSEAETIN